MKIALLTVLLLIALAGFVVAAPLILGYGIGTLIIVLAVFWMLANAAEKKTR